MIPGPIRFIIGLLAWTFGMSLNFLLTGCLTEIAFNWRPWGNILQPFYALFKEFNMLFYFRVKECE